jgi:hypothetical protein
LDNQQRLEAEVSDLMGTLELLREEGIGLLGPSEAIQAKIAKVREFMEYSKSQGALN